MRFFSPPAGGEGKHMGNEKVRPLRCRQGVFVGIPEHGSMTSRMTNSLPLRRSMIRRMKSGSLPGLGRRVGRPGSQCQRLNLLPVVAAGAMTASWPVPASRGRQRCRVQVAQRAERRQDIRRLRGLNSGSAAWVAETTAIPEAKDSGRGSFRPDV